MTTNSYIDEDMREKPDGVCSASGKTRTQVLVALMRARITRSKLILVATFEKIKETDSLLAAIRTYEDQVEDRIQEAEAKIPPPYSGLMDGTKFRSSDLGFVQDQSRFCSIKSGSDLSPTKRNEHAREFSR